MNLEKDDCSMSVFTIRAVLSCAKTDTVKACLVEQQATTAAAITILVQTSQQRTKYTHKLTNTDSLATLLQTDASHAQEKDHYNASSQPAYFKQHTRQI